MAGQKLIAIERETAITLNDEEDFMEITTHQRSMFTKLMRNPSVELIEDRSFNGQPGGLFRAPANLLTIRNGKRKTTGKKKRTFARGANVNKCGFLKPDGTTCQAPATDTGRCRWHPEK